MSKIKQLYSQISYFSNRIYMDKNTNHLFLPLLFTLFLVSVKFSVVAGVTSGNNAKFSQSHAAIKTFCSSTLYPELCFSAIAAEPSVTQTVPSQKDVIQSALLFAINVVQQNNVTVGKLLNTRGLSERGNVALHDCMETIDETLDELQKAMADLKIYPSGKSLYQHADDLKTLVSSTITNQDTCLNGFNEDEGDRNVKGALQGPEVKLEHMCSNALAMIKNMTDMDIANYEKKMGITKSRKLMEKEEGTEWPRWMSVADRRLLQATTVTPNVVVAADGSGNFKTVAAAVAAAPEKSSSRYVIKIKAGVYNENVEVPKHKTNIMFLGDGASTTIITGSRNVVDGSTTFHSATVAIVGERFLARDITIQNTAGPSKHQAVALRVGADLSAFYRCNFLAYQDTLYVHSNRQFFTNCLIAGTVDFIFGNSAVVFQDCTIEARRPNPGQKNMVTAQGRLDPNQNTGIVIQKSRIGASSDLEQVKGSFPTFLGRPWKEYSRTVIMQSSISDVIDPAGWHEWNGNFGLKTLFYGEYQNTGIGAGTSQRVKWEGYKVITSATEAQAFSPQNFIAGGSWLGSTGFPFSLGL